MPCGKYSLSASEIKSIKINHEVKLQKKKGMVVQWNLCNSLGRGCTLQGMWMSLLGNRLQPMAEKAQILKGRSRILSPFPCTEHFSSMMNTQKYQSFKLKEHGQHPWQCKNVTDRHKAEFCYKETKA